MDIKIKALMRNWQKRNISGIFCLDKAEAAAKLLEIIPAAQTIGFSGSQTLEQLGTIKALKTRGNQVFDPYLAGLSREEGLDIRRKAAVADYYLTSANAIAEGGELVFFSGYGHRISGIANARQVIVVCGINKLTASLEEAISRSRKYATPLNCKRLNWQSACLADGACHEEVCFAPDYKRMCCQILIIETEINPERLKVILVNEPLGF